MLLISFVGVLWVLSAAVVFMVDGLCFTILGYMVWYALAYSLGGSWLVWQVGHPLIALNAERYAREAQLRFALVRVNQNAEGIALHGSETQERQMLDRTIDCVATLMRELASGLARLTWVTSRLRVARPRRADPGCGAGLPQRRPVLWRADHDDWCFQPSAAGAPLVRGQLLADRRLAGDPATRRRAARGPEGSRSNRAEPGSDCAG
jgi:hypothetical protein